MCYFSSKDLIIAALPEQLGRVVLALFDPTVHVQGFSRDGQLISRLDIVTQFLAVLAQMFQSVCSCV